MGQLLQKVTGLSQTVTVDTRAVSIKDHLDDLPLADRAVAFLQGSLWPLVVITAGLLSSFAWTAALVWLVGYVLWS